jgi:hypothetical protein
LTLSLNWTHTLKGSRKAIESKTHNMAQIIRVSINIDQIDETRLYQGKKGRYLDLTLFLKDEVDQYGNHGFVTQNISKEEREGGVKMPIIGNAKVAGGGGSGAAPAATVKPLQLKPKAEPKKNPAPRTIPDEELPF